MAQQIINVGNVANDGQGDPLRTAFTKANDNFTELYDLGGLTGIQNGTSNIQIIEDGAITMAVGGVANRFVVTSVGTTTLGISSANSMSAIGDITAGGFFYGNGRQLTGVQATVDANSLVGTTLNSNIVNSSLTSVGILTSMYSSGNVTGGNVIAVANVQAGNVKTTGIVSATGNVTGGYFLGNGSQLVGISNINLGTSNVIVDVATGNVVVGVNGTPNVAVFYNNGIAASGNLTTGGFISATGNITGGNVITTTAVRAPTGFITENLSVGNILLSGFLNTSGNLYAGNSFATNINGNIVTESQPNITSVGSLTSLSVVGTVTANTIAGTSTTITSTGNLNISTTGNVVLSNEYINGLNDPVQDQDAATKFYVDNIASTGIAYHDSVTAATTTTVAAATGGTISYIEPNGAGNGVGAKLTTTGSFNLIDTANIQTIGTRVLVKNETTPAWNGVYTWANATSIVRSTDADEYGSNSAEQLSINDYFFVSGGNQNLGSAWIVSAPTGTITFGTSNILFSQFSSSQAYSANTSAGLSLTGQTFNAKVDNTTTAFDGGGNIVVKTGATLTTPNIGAATGTSLSTTGNITGGNLVTSGTTINTGVSTTGVISATGNITGGNIRTVGQVSATGNITGGNVNTTSSIHVGSDVSVTGIVSSAGNILSAQSFVASGNILTNGYISATGNITGNYYSGNGSQLTGIVATSIGTLASLSVTGNTVSGNLQALGNVITGNIVNSNANGVGNIGSSTTYFDTVFAKATSAQYADLAEKYRADAMYPPGTVLSFGGTAEVTQSTVDADRRIIGIVSTRPSYIMNSGIESEYTVDVALQGRVPCLIQGTVERGDMMVSAGNGRARAEHNPTFGTVIGKALENFSGEFGTIEVVVGRL